MRTSRDEGYHNNGNIESRKFKVVTAKVDNIYLTEAELTAMYELDLSKRPALDAARDVFLMGLLYSTTIQRLLYNQRD